MRDIDWPYLYFSWISTICVPVRGQEWKTSVVASLSFRGLNTPALPEKTWTTTNLKKKGSTLNM